ncbi:hypothetical protein NPIL_127621, partial [Nephila pilipes]
MEVVDYSFVRTASEGPPPQRDPVPQVQREEGDRNPLLLRTRRGARQG